MRGFTIGATIFMLTFVLVMAWGVNRRHDYEDACGGVGGVAVKGHAGPLVCIDRDSLIEIKR